MSIDNRLGAIAHELKLMIDSYQDYPGCRIDFTPNDIDAVIVDLIQIKNDWAQENATIQQTTPLKTGGKTEKVDTV